MSEQSASGKKRETMYSFSNTAFTHFLIYELKSPHDPILDNMLKNEIFRERMKCLFKSYRRRQSNENISILNGKTLLNGFAVNELFKEIINRISDLLVASI